MEGEGCADCAIDAGREPVAVLREPEFLLRTAEADPDELRGGGADDFQDVLVLTGAPFAEWRRIDTGYAEGWESSSGDRSVDRRHDWRSRVGGEV